MSRYFNTGQRVALWLRTNGKCAICKVVLDAGWHADHVHPWSLGGPTSIKNGQALCPTCNLTKGNTMTVQLRDWQSRALSSARFAFDSGQRDFLAVACPGSGKTTWALSVAWDLIDRKKIDLVLVVVPSDELRRQWSSNTATHTELREFKLRDVIVRKRGYNGAVASYQSLAHKTAGVLKREVNDRTLVILDEIHHAADAAAYGRDLRRTFGDAGYRLLLTGTPWRTRNTESIPFVTYDDITRELEIDYEYGYGQAVRDGVCRPIHFPIVNANVAWRDSPEAEVSELSMTADLDVEAADNSRAMAALLDGDWLIDVLNRASEDLKSYRREHPDAGGLVVARDQAHARKIQQELWKITGTKPRLVVSDDDDSKQGIEDYRESHEQWLVSVRMVSEGVDIPRLMVGVYATNYQTKMFFTQVVGRLVRVRPGERVTARMYVPPTQIMRQYAMEIEQISKYALEEMIEGPTGPGAGGDGPGFGDPEWEVLGSEATGLDRVVAAGQSIAGDLVTDWQIKLRGTTVPEHHAAALAQIALMDAPEPEPVVVQRKPRKVIEKELRDEIIPLVGKVARNCVGDYSDVQYVNKKLIAEFGVNRGAATVSQLEQQRDYLIQWLKTGVQP